MAIEETKKDVTYELVQFVVDTTFADLPVECIEIANRCIADGVACTMAGSVESAPTSLRQLARETGGVPGARKLGKGFIVVRVHIAMQVNGMSGHAHDYEDTTLTEEKDLIDLIHPTVQPPSACLAEDEKLCATAADFLTAFFLGFEVQVKIAEPINAKHFAAGRVFQTSGTNGILSATTAASKMMDLDDKQITNALGVASTMSPAWVPTTGHVQKPEHVP